MRWQGWRLFSTSCPHCRSIDFRSVGTRNALERAIHFLLHPFKCELCGHHFFLLWWHRAPYTS
jgi:transposase-like protein